MSRPRFEHNAESMIGISGPYQGLRDEWVPWNYDKCQDLRARKKISTTCRRDALWNRLRRTLRVELILHVVLFIDNCLALVIVDVDGG
jgi:hypothetical protein